MRLLHRVSRLPTSTAIDVADHFGGLAKLQRATVDDLMVVDDVDEATARSIRETLSRVTETTILDQYS
jgi:diadenylate cyclase